MPDLATPTALQQPSFSGRLIGEILIATAGLAPAKLEEALAAQCGQEAGSRLGEVLVRMKAVHEDDVLRALALQLDLPFVHRIDPETVPPELVAKVPINFAKQARVLPLGRLDGAVRLAVADPLDTATQESVGLLLGLSVLPEVAPPQLIVDAINQVYDRAVDENAQLMEDLETEDLESVAHELEEPTDLLEADDEAPIIRLVNSLLFRAVKERASDIHINPEERDLSVRYRIDGVLREVIRPPKRIQASMASRIKIMGGLNIAEKRLPQDGRIRIKIAGKDVDIRLSTVPTAHGERIVMRLLDKSNVLLDLGEIGFEPWQLKIMDQLITRSHGIVLVTGPTGSGKTTTLYSALQALASPEVNVVTIEDPIEMVHEQFNQIAANAKTGTGFAEALRHVLRQDPDVIMVGEVRDAETASQAVQAALTGHLVLTTMHTSDSVGAVARLRDLGVPSFLIGATLTGVVAQRLVRQVCPACAGDVPLTADEVSDLGVTHPEDYAGKLLARRGEGCARCRFTGYYGRTGLFEVLPMNARLRHLVASGATPEVLLRTARQDGLRGLRQHAVRKVAAGVTSFEEAMHNTADTEGDR